MYSRVKKSIRTIQLWIKVFLGIGLVNAAHFTVYKVKLRTGFLALKTPVSDINAGPFFRAISNVIAEDDSCPLVVSEADELLRGRLRLFHGEFFNAGSPPKWFQHSEDRYVGMHWTSVPINAVAGEDVKHTWDLSRFNWAIILACAFQETRNKRYIEALNFWLSDWNKWNASNTGVNWACAQEASIRVISLLQSSYILNQYGTPSKPFARFVAEHLHRISSTLQYSIAQQNNHGISEAAALYVGGLWLKRCSDCTPKNLVENFETTGRRVLERLVRDLIGADGSFSMYSITYHRSVLDTLSVVEFWRRELGAAKFSPAFYSSCSRLTTFLYQFVDAKSGDAPNIGANDGTMSFLPMVNGYRNFKPSLQLASTIFLGKTMYSGHTEHDVLRWFNLSEYKEVYAPIKKRSEIFADSGFISLRPSFFEKTWGVLRYPCYKFRPSHVDPLHFDLWFQGRNILRGTGSYSYNSPDIASDIFVGIKGHNSVQIDHCEPMPKLSKFLYGDWLRADHVSELNECESVLNVSASYNWAMGGSHGREVTFSDDLWTIKDTIHGHKEVATLRWYLEPTNWEVDGFVLSSSGINISIESNVPIIKFELSEGWESRFYSEKKAIPMLIVEVGPGLVEVLTKIKLF